MGEEWVGVCTRKRVRQGARLSVTFLPFILLLAFCASLNKTHTRFVNLPVYLPHEESTKAQISLSHTHPPSQNVLTQISVCSHNPKQQMSITFPVDKQFALTCVHKPGHNKHAYAFTNTVAWAGVLCNLPEGGDDTCAACLSGSPVGNWEPARCHGSVGINEAYWSKDTEA